MVTNQPSAGTQTNLQASCPGFPSFTENTANELISISLYSDEIKYRIHYKNLHRHLGPFIRGMGTPQSESKLSLFLPDHHHRVTTVQT